MDLRFLDPNGQPTREAFNERFSRLNDLTNNVGNEYVWAKQQTGVVPVAGTSSYTGMNFNNYVKVSSSVTISNGVITQVSPTEMLISSATDLQKLVGKYVWAKVFTNSAYNNVITYAPNVALSGSTIMLQNIEIGSVVLGYVNSPDPNAYPVNDGYTYTALGRLGDAFDGPKIATGSYTGTGKYGSSNPNSIALGFQAKAFLVVGGTITMVCPNLTTSYQKFTAYGWNSSTSVSGGFNIRVNGNNVQFYSDSGTTPAGTWYPVFQMNKSSVTYSYIAIG